MDAMSDGLNFDTRLILKGLGGVDSKEGLYVEFYMGELVSQFNTDANGDYIRTPKEFVKIRGHGSLDIVDRPVTDNDRKRFAEQYLKFKEGQRGLDLEGATPISKWKRIHPEKAAELMTHNIHTVEQVAAMTDGNLSLLGFDGAQLRKDAKSFLEGKKESVADDRVATLEKQMAELMAINEELIRRAKGENKPEKPKKEAK